MRELSDEEVFGAAPVAARELSDAEVFGAPSIDDRAKEFGEMRPIRGPVASIASVFEGLSKSLPQGAELARQGIRQEFSDLIGSDQMRKDAERKYEGAATDVALSTPEFESDTARGIYSGASSLLRTSPGVAASILTRSPTPALATIGTTTQAESYGKYKGRGATPGEALLGSAGEGAVEVGTELLPMGFLVKKFGKVGAGEFLRGMLARELPTEQIATLAQDAIDTAIANPDKSWDEYISERPGAAYQTLLATLVQSGLMGGASAGVAKLAGAPSPAPAPAPVEPPKAPPAPRMITLPDGQLVSETDLENMPIADRIRAQAGGVAPSPEPAPQPVAGLLTQQDPDPMVAFPDGSTARKSEVDAMVARMPIEERAAPFNLGAEPAAAPQPTAADVVAQNAVPERSSIAEVIARNTGISRPEINTRARAKDVTAAVNEKVGVTVDPETQQERPLTAAEYYRRYLGVPSEPTTNQLPKADKLVVAPKATTVAEKETVAPAVNKVQEIDQTVKTQPVVARKPEIAPQEGVIAPNTVQPIDTSTESVQTENVNEAAPVAESQAAKESWQMTETEFGEQKKQEALSAARNDLARAKSGEEKPNVFSNGAKSKAALIRMREAEIQTIETAKPEKFSGDHLAQINKAMREGKQIPAENLTRYDIQQPSAVPDVPKTGTAEPNVGTNESPVSEETVQEDSADRISEIDAELSKLQAKYEKKSASFGAMVPPSIKTSALSGITKQMDKLEAEKASLQEQAPAPAKKKGEPTQLYGGLPLDKIAELFGLPQPVKGIKEAVTDIKALRNKDAGIKKDTRGILHKLYDGAFLAAHDRIKEAGDRYKSPTLTKLAKQIYAVAGKADAERSYFEAQNRTQAQINKAVKLWMQARELGASDKQIEAQIRNLAARQGRLGDVVKEIAKIPKEERAYMNEAAGHEAIGDRGPGFFPVHYDAQKVHNNKEAFIQDAAGAYYKRMVNENNAKENEDRISESDLEAEARRRAEAFWYRKVFGDEGRPGVDTRPTKEKFTKERSFDEDAYFADKLGKYLTDNPLDALIGYLHRAGKWAEVTRRWGENWSKWPEMEAQMKDEGVPVEVVEEMRKLADTIVNGAQNDLPAWLRTFLSGVHTSQSLGLLEKSTMSSLVETLMPIVRSNGDLRVAAYTLTNTVRDALFKVARMSERNQSLNELWDFSERLGTIASMEMNALLYDRFTGSEDMGKSTGKVMHRFYSGIQMTQLTNRNYARGAGAASVFLDNLSRQLLKGHKDSPIYLRELGVPKGQERAFAEYVQSLKQSLPKLPDYGQGTPMEEAYRTALLRFVDQTNMRPNRATRPRYMSTPLGVVIGAIQSFSNTFHKNVLMRVARNMKTAATEADLSAFERLRMAGGSLPGLALMTLMSGMIWGLRDKLFNPREKTTGAKIETAMSSTGLFGKFDPWIQIFSGTRYGRSVSQASLGPALGQVGSAADALLTLAANNSDETNASERKAAKAGYQVVLEPAWQVGAGYLFLVAGGLSQFIARSMVPSLLQEPFVDAVAGEQDKKSKKPIKGMVETMLEDKKTSTGGHGSSRSSSRSSGRPSRQSGR